METSQIPLKLPSFFKQKKCFNFVWTKHENRPTMVQTIKQEDVANTLKKLEINV